MQYTKEYLLELDKTIKVIPLYYDKMFKSIIMKNKEIFKRFLIDTLRLGISYEHSAIENIIVRYDISTNTIFPDHKKIVMKNVDYYSNLYYNLKRKLLK